MVKIYVTKYALTLGIKAVEVEGSNNSNGMFVNRNEYGYPTFYHKGDYALTLDAAKENAEAMRLKKISSLRKQLEKLGKMTF